MTKDHKVQDTSIHPKHALLSVLWTMGIQYIGYGQAHLGSCLTLSTEAGSKLIACSSHGMRVTAIVNESVVVIMTSIVVYSAVRRRFSSQEIRNSKYICCQIERYPSSSDVATDAATLAAADDDDGGGGGDADDDVPATCSIIVFVFENQQQSHQPDHSHLRRRHRVCLFPNVSVAVCPSIHPSVCLAVCLHAK